MENQDLINIAKDTCKSLDLGDGKSAGSVGAAILSDTGSIYTGICIDLYCGLGFCAEASAISEMLKNGESKIRKIVAVQSDGSILPPCGRCREMILQIDKTNLSAQVIIDTKSCITLSELLPINWL